MNRRQFLSASASTAFSFAAAPALSQQRTRKYKTALIGSGWWGMNILRTALASGTSQPVALCDVDQSQLDRALAEVEMLAGVKPRGYKDYREMLEREKPEIVIVGTPDHWHALNAIDAMKAGAHVYVEKPIGHTINEGKAMVAAARKYDRVVQVGTHRRASPHNRSGMEFLKSGKAGKISMVRAFVHYAGGPGQPSPESEPPSGLDWDMWCGPAPYRPYNKAIHPRGFRQFLDYANGQLGDWGIHWMDQILWWTEEKGPRRIASTGGRFFKKDSTDGPDTQVATFEFENFVATWEHRYYAGNEAEKTNIGCYFYGSNGTLHMGWLDGWTFYPAKKGEPVLHEDPKLHKPDDQNIPELWANFIECVRSGARPMCDIEIGHRSTNMALLGMLALKAQRTIHWDPDKEVIVNDPEASKLLSRPYRKPWVYPTV